MGRKSTGWKLRQRGKGTVYTVRFWLEGVEVERSTGTCDPSEAAKEAARIYAAHVQTGRGKPKRHAGPGHPLEDLLASWLAELSATHDPGTCTTWELYARTHWLPHFGASHHVTDEIARQYMLTRLRSVQGSTVRKELSALRQFVRWGQTHGYFLGVTIPGVPKKAIGTAFKTKRRSRAIELSPDETEALIEALPEWSTSKKVDRFPIRARFRVGYETSLRPTLLDLIETPKNYRPGSSSITITPEIDKNRWAREVPLSPAARKALDSVCPAEGLIFGKHRYEEHLRASAKETLSPDRAERFTGAHLRSARVTHWLEETGNLPGTQYLAGHKLATTTAAYVRPSLRAALDVISAAKTPRKRRKSAG
jgi:integrase